MTQSISNKVTWFTPLARFELAKQPVLKQSLARLQC